MYLSPLYLPFIFYTMTIEASFLHKTKIQEVIALSTATQEFKNIKAGRIE